MRKIILRLIVIGFLITLASCKNKNDKKDSSASVADPSETAFDSTLVQAFFVKYPKLKKYQPEVVKLYRSHDYHYVWYDKKCVNEFGNLLYSKINNLEEEGIQVDIPYKDKLKMVYECLADDQKPDLDAELMYSAYYFFYTDKVYHGYDNKKIVASGWFLPRKKQSYVTYLDSLLIRPKLINKDKKDVLSQYYLLKEILSEYREIEKKGGWNTIAMDPAFKSFKPGDASPTIAQVRTHLFITGDIASDSKSNVYDGQMAEAILKYKKRNANTIDKTILPRHIKDMNVPVAQRIKTIMVNMERCRWISNDITKAKELIVINVPAYELTYFKDGKPALRSKVVVGKALNQTVIFSAPMSYIVFSPYWNIPASILKAEILPGIEKNENYLEEHDMEWNGPNVRQRPGPTNSLGLIKFMFPNSNAIYLHDTPAKSLFGKEDRASSHGCIRVARPVDLANAILAKDKNWNPEKIKEAMNSGVESQYALKNKIPVYIGYFTAWVDNEGAVHFYDDIYQRDDKLASMIFTK